MASPKNHCYTTANSGASAVSSLNIDKPTSASTAQADGAKNAAVGDLVIIYVGNDDNTNTAQWNNSTLKPTGFTLIKQVGEATRDCHCAAFYRFIDGTEGSTFNIPAQSADNTWAVCELWSEIDPSTPIHLIGATATNSAAGPSSALSITQMTTTVADCKLRSVWAYDGGDAAGFTVGGTGWSEIVEVYANTAANGASGGVGQKTMSGTGATVACTVNPAFATTDGMVGFQFAVAYGALPAILGDGAAALALGRAATGAVAIAAVGAAALGLGATGSGTVADPEISGIGSAALALSGSASAQVAVAGVGSQPLVLGRTASGLVAVAGVGSSALALSGSGAGTVAGGVFVTLPTSIHIAAGGTDATTARLTPPAGKTTGDFDAGWIVDDVTPFPSITLAAGGYTEVEAPFHLAAGLATDDVVELQIVESDGTPLTSESGGYLSITIGATGINGVGASSLVLGRSAAGTVEVRGTGSAALGLGAGNVYGAWNDGGAGWSRVAYGHNGSTGAGPNGPTLNLAWIRPLEVGTIGLYVFAYAGTSADLVTSITDPAGNTWRRLGGGVASSTSRALEVWGCMATGRVEAGANSVATFGSDITAWSIFGDQFVGGLAGLVVEAAAYQDFIAETTLSVGTPTAHNGDLLLGFSFGWSVGLPGDLFTWFGTGFNYGHGYEAVHQVLEWREQATADAGTVVDFQPYTSQDAGLQGLAILADYVEAVGTGAGSFALSQSAAATIPAAGVGSAALSLVGSGAGVVGDAPITGVGAASLVLGRTASGQVGVAGVGSSALVLGRTASGTIPSQGTGNATVALAGSGTASSQIAGVGAAALGLSGAGAGVVGDPPREGVGNAALALSGVGTATADVAGVGAGSVALAGTGAPPSKLAAWAMPPWA